MQTGAVPNEAFVEIGNTLAKHFHNTEQCTFHSFYQSFQQVLTDHSKKAVNYKQVVRNAAQKRNCDQKLVFLIEVHTAFSDLYLHDGDKIRLAKNGSFVLFDQIVKLLEITDKRVDHIVLCWGDALFNEAQTIAFRTDKIKADLKKHRIQTFFYCGHDILLSPGDSFVKNFQLNPKFEFNEKSMTLLAEPEFKVIDPVVEDKYVWHAIRGALFLKACKHPFAVNTHVEMMLEFYSEYIRGWKKSTNDNWSYQPILDPNVFLVDVEKAKGEFCTKWGLEDCKD